MHSDELSKAITYSQIIEVLICIAKMTVFFNLVATSALRLFQLKWCFILMLKYSLVPPNGKIIQLPIVYSCFKVSTTFSIACRSARIRAVVEYTYHKKYLLTQIASSQNITVKGKSTVNPILLPLTVLTELVFRRFGCEP